MLRAKATPPTTTTVGTTAPTATPPTTTTVGTTAPTATPQISYSTSVDPTFTQSSSNPLDVTYTFSASAIETDGTGTINLGADDELPDGVLNFYSQGLLACSINVGGSTSGGTCAVTYASYGTYQVTTEYLPTGATPVTETDSETITEPPAAPIETSTSLSFMSYTSDAPYYSIALDLTANAPLPWEYTTTITDITTGESSTSPVFDDESSPTTQDVDVAFETGSPVPEGDVDVSALGTVSDTDTICVSATTLASTIGDQEYLASTSASYQVWPWNGENACP